MSKSTRRRIEKRADFGAGGKVNDLDTERYTDVTHRSIRGRCGEGLLSAAVKECLRLLVGVDAVGPSGQTVTLVDRR
jgi:hypothetical protein